MGIQRDEAFERSIRDRFGDLVNLNTCKNSDGDYMSWDAQVASYAWQAAQAVPEGFVLVPKDKAKDTERLNFLLGGDRYIRTVVQRDIRNEDYEKIGEHYLFTEVYWIDGWDYHENTSSDTERGAIDKAIIESQEQGHD